MPESRDTHDAKPRPTSREPTVSVPGYDISDVLGRGGMGVVYHATQTRLKRPVALKVVLSGVHLSDRERERFEAEARALAALDHPNIVTIYDFGEAGGLPWFALEFCPGGTLADRLKDGTLPPVEATALVATLAGAMDAVHRQGMIHRDLKPANVLFSKNGVPKIADFGLVREGDGLGTATGVAVGTPMYMAPEQARGEKVDHRVDVYALGAILYRCLTGRPPYQGPNAFIIQMLAAYGQTPVPPVRDLNPKVPEWLATVCTKAMARDANDRYASAAELAAALTAPPLIPSPRPRTRPPLLVTPFSATEARAAQEAWAAYIGVRKHEGFVDLGGERLPMVLIPPGTFTMGSPPDEAGRFSNEGPTHRVTIREPFWVGKTPVTQAQYRAVTGKSPSYFAVAGRGKEKVLGLDTSRFPVESVNWENAVAFCEAVRAKIRRRLMLLTEAQWEWACRAGTQTRFSFGDDEATLGEFAWFLSNSDERPHPVGEKQPNAFGLWDMHGNVWEWCADWLAPYTPDDATDPEGPAKGSQRVNRGGCWGTSETAVRTAFRTFYSRSASRSIGFRVAAPATGTASDAP